MDNAKTFSHMFLRKYLIKPCIIILFTYNKSLVSNSKFSLGFDECKS